MLEFNGTFIVAMLSFVVFIMIMNAIFYQPILNVIRKREGYINSNYEKSQEFEKAASEFKQIHTDKIEKTQDRCRKEFSSTIDKIQTQASEKIAKVKEQTKTLTQERKNILEQQKNDLKETVKHSLANDLAKVITDKLTKDITD